MRTTLTIDPENARKLSQFMKARKMGLKQAVNEALRLGLSGPATRKTYKLPVLNLGLRSDTHVSLRTADALEDAETIRKMELRK